MSRARGGWARTVWCLAAGALGACGTSPPLRYYTLIAAPAAMPNPSGAGWPAIVVGPVSIPETVDRPEIVLRLSDTQLTLADQDRWAEPLGSELTRALIGHLARALTGARVVPTGRLSAAADIELRVDVQRFESRLGNSATLEALWSLRRPDRPDVRGGRSYVQLPAAGGVDALVAAHARALALISEEIAQAIRTETKLSAAPPALPAP